MKAISLWQPWASLIALGVKTIETRSWSTSYRGTLAIHAAKRRPSQAERLGVYYVDWGLDPSLGRFTNGGFDEGCGFLLVDGSQSAIDDDGLSEPLPARAFTPLHLGAVVATCTLTDVVPIIDGGDCEWHAEHPRSVGPCCHAAIDGQVIVHQPDAPMHTTVLVEEAYGDYEPGRFAWLLDDIKPTTDRCPLCRGDGDVDENDEPDWLNIPCRVCGRAGTCDPIPAKGRQGLWEWTP